MTATTKLNVELHTQLKNLAKKERLTIDKLLSILVKKVVSNELLISDSQELFTKNNVLEILEENTEGTTEKETKEDKELTLAENIETNLLRINRKLEELENKLNNITGENALEKDELKLRLIEKLLG